MKLKKNFPFPNNIYIYIYISSVTSTVCEDSASLISNRVN